ncbi:DUF6011 domain-containing protein [Amycolatopsis orientalis]|uniref:DUF6011 domain-containing protein n=1 Tax=Amycolatopsis orientalis TaxID=31958 RepID=UPI000A72A05A
MTVCCDCHRPLTDPVSVARRRGPVCTVKFEGDTHTSPKPRRPARRRRLPEDEPLTGFPPLQKVQKGHRR